MENEESAPLSMKSVTGIMYGGILLNNRILVGAKLAKRGALAV